MSFLRRFPCCLVLLLLSLAPASAQVIISEFMADNTRTLADEDGEYSDWVELYNTGTAEVNLSGWALTDDPLNAAKWFIPSTNLPPKGFLIVFASGKNRQVAGAPLHADFSLRASGEYLALLRSDGSVATEFAPSFPAQAADFSYGLAQNVTTNVLIASGVPARALVPLSGTLGTTWLQPSFNDSSWIAATTGIGYETAVAGFAVYNYIANVSVCSLLAAQEVIATPAQQQAVYAENAPVFNYINTDATGNYGNDRSFPGLTIGVDRDNFVVQAIATITIPAAGEWTFGVNSDDGFSLTIGGQSMSYPDPRGPADSLQTFYFAQPGEYPLELIFYECGGGSGAELWAAPGNFGFWDSGNFRLVGDTANGGLAVTATVVSGGSGGSSYRPLIKTDLQTQMAGVNSSAYIRIPFSVQDPASLTSLTLRMKYDDGFAAYINGQEISRRNSLATPSWNSTATASHPDYQAMVFEDINVTEHLGKMVAGGNVLAIQGMNQNASDTDFLILPELVEFKANPSTYQFFASPTPGGLNNSGFVAFVPDTQFSVESGFFTNALTLAMTCPTLDVRIRYTTDGSPPSLTNGLNYTGPLTINKTAVIRAAGFKPGHYPSDIRTHTYIFPADVIRQSPTGTAPPGWPSSWGANTVDYGMDPNVVNNQAYGSTIQGDLQAIPTYSIVTDLKNLFDPATGIYANPGGDGIEWERPAAFELIYPDGTKGFQINGGLRIRGGYSRSPSNPKHAFRLLFRNEYGEGRLKYPVFAKQDGANSFDGFDLRTFQNYSWSFGGDSRCTGMRDQFNRDTQLAMGHQAERGDYYHLYLNGQYWGVYNTAERAEASFGESYYGGKKEDYDVVKIDSGYVVAATDGNLDAWTRLWRAATNGFASDAAYYKIQGLNVDGTPNPNYENLLDVDNIIDYMLLVFFTGNKDAPVSWFLSEASPNNMYAVRNRTGLYGGFRFMAHDGEHTLLTEDLNMDRTGPFPAGDPVAQGAGTAFTKSNPQYFFTRLTANTEFRMKLADHIQKHFFNGGLLTTESCRARILVRSNELYRAMVCESARWGDAKTEPPKTRNTDWINEVNRICNNYLVNRPPIVLTQLRNKGWLPGVAAPTLSASGGNVPKGTQVTMTAPAGTIYYTKDGTDPRLQGGALSGTALAYSSPLVMNQSTRIKARALSGATWSPLIDVTFYVIQNFTELLVTEVMYHPLGTTNLDGDNYEFIELKNVASSQLELSGVSFTSGISFTFPVGTFLAPGQFVVLVNNPAAFTSRYPRVRVDGVYTGNLSNGGERVSLAHVTGAPIFSLSYETRPPWPQSADGSGFSLVPVNPNLNAAPDDPLNWRASSNMGGSPGTDDAPSALPRVVINEALTHTDPPQIDTLELYNPHTTNVSVGNWFLTDDRTVPKKFKIPANTTIGPLGYLQFSELDWYADPSSSNSFRLDSHGEQIYLYSADANGDLTGYSDGFAFGAAQNGVSFGRHVNSVGEVQYPAQIATSFGKTNSGPSVGPVVINEIHYYPAPGGDEFVELKSITNAPVNLFDPAFPTNRWRISGISYDFPPNVVIPSQGLLLVVAGDPAAFRARYGVPAQVQIFGPFTGNLQDNGETLALQFPDHPDIDTNSGAVVVPYIDVDVVRYNDRAPWPADASGTGYSLERIKASAYGNEPLNWRSSAGQPSPGLENSGNRPPIVNAGLDVTLEGTSFPISIPLSGTATDDGQPNPPRQLTFMWTQLSGPGKAWFEDANRASTAAFFPGVGTYVLRLAASDSELQSVDDLSVTISRTLGPVTLSPKASTWKYLDDGSNQGTAWTSRTFNDAAWKSGVAPLGYGDANGQPPATFVGYGPDSNNKYVTTYFRRSFTVADPRALRNVVVSVQRDDGVVVYLNGTGIFTNGMPVSFDYSTFANVTIGDASETAFVSETVDPSLLVAGNNVIAAEIHQATGSSSDIVFDLELAAESFPANQPPTVNAGADQQVTLPAQAQLSGSVTDDGLPVPPGLITFAWSKAAGPGTVSFGDATALKTTAAFSAPGTYTLRLSATDGILAAQDDLLVAVGGEVPPPFSLDSLIVTSGGSASIQIRFSSAVGCSYSVQYRDSLPSASWRKLQDIPAQPSTTVVEVSDPIAPNSAARYYRVVSPIQP